MPKILLVEDDINLREIFEMRLQAEGYLTMTAADGEEALVVALKQKPDLIIADVMMPKLSGFEMLETLRSTPEMSSVKVIMMTALGQAEDQIRGEKLGVVKYLVKSQVTLEDFVRVVQEVLQPGGGAKDQPGTPNDQQANAKNNVRVESENAMQDDQNTPTMPAADGQGQMPPANPSGADSSAAAPASDSQMSSADEQATVQGQINDFASAPAAPADDSAAPAASPSDDSSAPAAPAADPATPPADTPPSAPTV